jgi:hypothetical protein
VNIDAGLIRHARLFGCQYGDEQHALVQGIHVREVMSEGKRDAHCGCRKKRPGTRQANRHQVAVRGGLGRGSDSN